MLAKIIQNDLKNSKLVSLTIFAFILFASFLLSTVGIVTVNLSASVNRLLAKAQTPHFLQMQLGDCDEERMFHFAQNNEHVLKYQTMPFLNVDANDILINNERFSENSQDNGFSYQSEHFDFLLDVDNDIIYPNEGEIYVPLAYYANGSVKAGDCIRILDRDFIVQGAIRDAQMSSMLASSKRFLIHPNDYEKIKPVGREEFLIEFLLADLSHIDQFQGDYANANLESNGPTITYSIIKLMNALTDGIMIALLLLTAFLIVVVSFLCIRLTLIAKIEDEYKTIGVLKAIGIRLSLIKKMYRAKYALIAFLACVCGLILSFALSDIFLRNIRLFFGENESGLVAGIGALLASLFIFLIVMLYINRFLHRLRKLSPASAINTGVVSDDASSLKRFKLRNQNLLSTDFFLGVNLILTRKKTYFTFVLILIIASFVMILPNNIYSSMASNRFIAYMGVGNGEAMMIFPGNASVNDLNFQLEQNPDIEQHAIYDSKSYEFLLDENSVSKMWVTLGDQNQFSVLYTEGHAPQNDNEIALSYLQASSLEKKIGDTITLIIHQKEKDFTICGFYSDITNGGKTARATFSDTVTPSLSKSVIMNFKHGTPIGKTLASFEHSYPNAKVYHIKSYRDAVFGSTLNSIRTSGITATILSLGLTFLITLLFINMLIVKDRRNISALRAVGFTNQSLRKLYAIGSILLVIVSMIVGSLLVSSIGQSFAGVFIQTMGIANFTFDIDISFVFLIAPICTIACVWIGTNLATRSVKKIAIPDYIKGVA